MENEMITIEKKPGKKDCVRISKVEDIPDFLQSVIRIEGEMLVLDNIEGEKRAPLGSVIAYEQLDSGKMNVWNKANWKETTREIDGVFYEIPKPNKAIRVIEEMPELVTTGLGERFKTLPDGTHQIDTGEGLSQCAPNNGYLVIYGTKKDGSLDANFLTKGTPSFKQYYLVDEFGNLAESLEEYDAKITEEQKRI